MALARPNLRFSTTLYQAADESQTTLFLNAVPVTVPCYLIIDPRTDKEEVVKVTAKSTNSITVVRGQGGTSATDHSVGAAAVDYNVPSYFTDLADAYENVFDDEGNPKEEGSLVTRDGEQELTNKTLTDPVLNGDLTGNAILDEDDMASDSDTKVPTQQSVKAYVDGGWSKATDTLIYVSATSFKIEGVDRTTVYTKGTRIKLDQTTTKYFVVTGSSYSTDTTVTITGGTDYTLANAAITDPFYSYQANPQGYPGWFNWTPTYGYGSGSFSSVTTTMARFGVIGQMCFFNLYATGTTGGSTGPNITATLPITSANNRSMFTARVSDGGLSLTGTAFLENSTTELTVKRYDGQNWSNGSGRQIEVAGEYRI